MQVDTLTPVLDGAPGEHVVGRLEITNDSRRDAEYRLLIVGLDGSGLTMPVSGGAVRAGGSAEVEVPLDIPHALGVGRYTVALEVLSDRTDERPAIAEVTVAIESVEHVALVPEPSIVRGRRRGRFKVDITNNEPGPVDIAVVGGAPDVEVRFKPDRVQLDAGGWARVKGKAKGPRRWSGEPIKHILTLSARGKATMTSVTAPFVQRSLFPWRWRSLIAGLLVLALWAGIAGGALYWWTQRDSSADTGADTASAELVDLDGDGVPDAPGEMVALDLDGDGVPDATGELVDLDGDGVPDAVRDPTTGELIDLDGDGVPDAVGDLAAGAGTDVAGEAGDADADADAAAAAALPTATLVGGTVTTADGSEPSDVSVQLAPIDLGQQPSEEATLVGFAGRSRPVKLWPARFGRQASNVSIVRQTEAVVTDAEGAWLFAEVPLRQNYEVVFAKGGYDTQSFVVSPPDDGTRVELDVELEPASGKVSGSVTGPGGALGGVDIVVTDGTLTFTTTSATEGDVGSWGLDGISTPGVYTLTASKRGFGTEVLQLPFEPGDDLAATQIVMRQGVGSITGRITAGGEAVGGVTVTASNGENTFTASSLTAGATGTYNLPQLPLPRLPFASEYTVRVELDGFIPQTRLISAAGAVSGVDFDLTATTATLTGTVTSSAGGALVGASVTISQDDLSFRTATAAEPDAGSFAVGDLPPGTYLVTIDRFDHQSASQIVTLTAGTTLDMGEIELIFTSRPPLEETGSLIVRVIDSEENELDNATVTVWAIDADPATDEPIAQVGGPEATQVTFEIPLPVGTYRVRVERNQFRTAEQRVSVGLGQSTRTFRLLRLGQVTGTLIDSITDAQLDNYRVSIFAVNGDGTETFLEFAPVPDNAEPNVEGNILWESSPNSLTTGLYRVAISTPPPGYAVANDQILDPNVTTEPVEMRFAILPDSEETVQLEIEADPYPEITGRIFRPIYDATSSVPVFDPIDDDSLAVSMTCGAAPDTVTAPAELLDVAGLSPQVDGYRFTPEAVQASQLIGECTLNVSADGFAPSDVALTGTVAVSDGNTLSDRIANIALVAAADPFGGTVFWRDGTFVIPVEAAELTTSEPAIVGFDATEDSGIDASPQASTQTLSTTSDELGVWSLDGQVFGLSRYVFSHPNFQDAEMDVLIDETERVVSAVTGSPIAVTERTTGCENGSDLCFDVELRPPNPGSLSGIVTILTCPADATRPGCDGIAAFDDVGYDATGPGGIVRVVTQPTPPDGTFGIDPAAAGTWTITFTAPTNHIPFSGAPLSVTQRVDPDAAVDGFDTVLVELGTFDLEVLDTSGNAITPAPTYQLDAVDLPTSRTGSVDGTGSAVVAGIPVDLTDPVNVDEGYLLDVAAPTYDTTAASITIDGVTTTGSTTDIVLNYLAGEVHDVDISLPKFGTIEGEVVGRIGPDVSSPTEDLPFSELTITATPVDPSSFQPTTGTVLTAQPGPGGVSDNDFVFTGAPGPYLIEVTHPNFQMDLVDPPADGALPEGVYLMANDGANTLAGPLVLEIEPGTLDLTVAESIGGVGVNGAVVTLTSGGTQIATGTTANDGTADGRLVLSDLTPGTYTMEIRRLDLGVDVSYPVIVDITVPRGASAAARTTTIAAPFPSLDASIVGTIVALNSANQSVVPPTITIDREYTPPRIDQDGNLTDNTATDPAPTSATSTTDTAALTGSFEFGRLGAGSHELTFETGIDGYTLESPASGSTTVDVAGSGPTPLGSNVVYRVSGRDVTVTIEGATDDDDFPGLTVTLSGPNTYTPTTSPAAGEGGTFTFTDVAPHTTAYTVNISDDLHATPTGMTVLVDPGIGTIDVGTVSLIPDLARIAGTVFQNDGSSSVPLDAQGTIQLFRGATELPVADYAGGGTYSYDVDIQADYTLVVNRIEFTGQSVGVTGVQLGQITEVPAITLLKQATVNIAVTNTGLSNLAVQITDPTGTGVTPAVTGTTFSFVVDPDVTYTFTVTADGHYSATVQETPTPGETITTSVTLTNRTLGVTVSGPTTATVEARSPAGTTVSTITQATSSTFSFPVDVASLLPLTGAGDIRVSATDYRTQVVTWPDQAAYTTSVTLLPDATVSGTVTSSAGSVEGVAVTATAAVLGAGDVTLSTTVSGGSYTIPGLTVGTDGLPVTWTISADQIGVGAATATTSVSATSTSTITQDLTMTPQTVTATFQVRDAAGAAVTDATVLFGSSSGSTDASGDVMITSTEDALSWSATSPTSFGASGTATVTTSRTITVPVQLIARPTISGTVTVGGDPANRRVWLCEGAVRCLVGDRLAFVDSSSSTGEFSFSGTNSVPAPGIYSVSIRVPVNSTQTTFIESFTVAADGSGVPPSITLAVP